MNRESLYFTKESDPRTYDFDESLPALPLPELHATLERYVASVRPFGTSDELRKLRDVVERFERGAVQRLQDELQRRAQEGQNWLGTWWEDYGYLTLRLPLIPYQIMSMAAQLEIFGVCERREDLLKNCARQMQHSLEFWDMTRKATLRPHSSKDGKVKFSSALFKRVFSTSRVPGPSTDRIEQHFHLASECETPAHIVVMGNGRHFTFDGVHEDGSILTAPELLVMLQRISSTLEHEPMGDCVPLLTHDERSSWAANRQMLLEYSSANKDILKLIESSVINMCFDNHEPRDYEEVVQLSLYGDQHSRWSDRSSTFVAYRNGKFAYTGEHSCYDGSISVSYAQYIQLGLLECPEPDWHAAEQTRIAPLRELKFDLNEKLLQEVARLREELDQKGMDVIVTFTVFEEYGKAAIKAWRLHPDSFVQTVMQWAYLQLHDEVASTYETALMRQYYNGRTDTMRSCTPKVADFLRTASDAQSTESDFLNAFCAAVMDHSVKMAEVRGGCGIDRHLFGLWCLAHESGIDVSEFYEQPLYSRSGGGGNFVLSTSSLGYSSNVGFVAPMAFDGYGVFYSIMNDSININTTAYRDSYKTSARKFNEVFKSSLNRVCNLLDHHRPSKL